MAVNNRTEWGVVLTDELEGGVEVLLEVLVAGVGGGQMSAGHAVAQAGRRRPR